MFITLVMLVALLPLILSTEATQAQVGCGGTSAVYEYYDTGGTNSTAIYGDSWLAQTFTLGSDAHTISSIRLKLHRAGTVGSVTVSIKDTTLAGHPDALSESLVSVTLSGDSVSTSSSGVWTMFDFSYPEPLVASTKYAVVVEASSAPDSSNAIYMHYTINGTYSGGNYEYSANGGTTWYSETSDDFLFEVWGEASFDVCSARIFRDYKEAGDWLIVANYLCSWPPYSPDTTPMTCFSAQFLIDSDIKASIGMPLWGYAPVGIYMSPDVVEHLEWGAANSEFRIVGTGACGGITQYTSLEPSWVGSNLNLLDDWVMRVTGEMEEYYGIAFTTIDSSSVVLNTHGGMIFNLAIPYLCCIRDHLYYTPCVCKPDVEFGGYYQETLNWQTLLGPRIVAALNTTGGVVDLSGKAVAQAGFLALFAVIAVVTAVAVPEHKGFACVMLALPFAFIGWLLGIVPIAAAAGMASIAVIALVWAVWLMRT